MDGLIERAPGGATDTLAAFAAGLRYDMLPEAVRHAAKRHLLDTLGAIIAGADQPVTQAAAKLFMRLCGPGTVPVPGMKERFDILTAAYLAAVAGHGLELDDGYRAGSVHPGTVVVPALLATTANAACDGRTAIVAMTVGYELVARTAKAVHPTSRRRGFHNTAVAGVFGAAAAAAVLQRGNAAQVADALGLAASGAGGLFAFLSGGGDTKRLHPGHAAREGVLAALMAMEGLHGPAGVFETKDGFLQAFADGGNLTALTADLGKRWAIAECYTKPYACCRHLHPALDALIEIGRNEGVRAGEVKAIEISTYAIAAAHAKVGWDDMLAAQLSFPFCAATALHHGILDPIHFQDAARQDQIVTELCNRIVVTIDPECDSNYPALRAAKVKLTTNDGRSIARFVKDPYGSFTNQMTDEALASKFRTLVSPAYGAQTAEHIEAIITGIDTQPSLNALTSLL